MTKFLGILLDQHLSWKHHINHVAKKVSKTIGIISKAHFFLSSKSLSSLYYTLVYPYLNYCNIESGARRIHPIWIGFSTYRNASSESFVKLNILLILHLFFGLLISLTKSHNRSYYGSCLESFSIIAFFVARFMYSYQNNLLPHTFNTTFVTNRQVHTYNTRNANNYRPYFCRTNIKQSTILHLGPKLWNSLPHVQPPPPPPPIQGKKVNKPPTPPPHYFSFHCVNQSWL